MCNRHGFLRQQRSLQTTTTHQEKDSRKNKNKWNMEEIIELIKASKNDPLPPQAPAWGCSVLMSLLN